MPPSTAARSVQQFWRLPPPGRPSAGEVVENQRQRLFLGIARAVARKGYANTSVADVLAHARVSRRTFYEQFRDKEDCFLAAYEVVHRELISRVVNAQPEQPQVLAQVRAAHAAYLAFFAAEPELCAAFLIGIRSAGTRAMARRASAQEEFAQLHKALHRRLRKRMPGLPELPDSTYLALVGGTHQLVTSEIEAGRAASLPQMLPVVLYLTLSVYGLGEVACTALRGDEAAFGAPEKSA